MATINKEMLKTGIKDLTALEQFGRSLAKKDTETDTRNPQRNWTRKEAMTTSQIRKFFGAIKRIQADFENLKGEIILLEPKLAYAVGRDLKKSKIDEFYKEISPLIREINEDEAKFKNFVSIIEAIVAYHKVQGGN